MSCLVDHVVRTAVVTPNRWNRAYLDFNGTFAR